MASTKLKYAVSEHARLRCQQRGVPLHVLSALQDVADRSVPVGGGLTADSLSRRGLKWLREEGYPVPAILERLPGLTVVQSSQGETVTVLHATARRYRRGQN
jgi:hypothetical protein